MQKIIDNLSREANNLEKNGYPFLAKIIRDSLKTRDVQQINAACMRASIILETGKRWKECANLRRIANTADSNVRAALWGK